MPEKTSEVYVHHYPPERVRTLPGSTETNQTSDQQRSEQGQDNSFQEFRSKKGRKLLAQSVGKQLNECER